MGFPNVCAVCGRESHDREEYESVFLDTPLQREGIGGAFGFGGGGYDEAASNYRWERSNVGRFRRYWYRSICARPSCRQALRELDKRYHYDGRPCLLCGQKESDEHPSKRVEVPRYDFWNKVPNSFWICNREGCLQRMEKEGERSLLRLIPGWYGYEGKSEAEKEE